jgi:hypothetical protein
VTGKASGCEVGLSKNRFTNQEAFVSHTNAALTPRALLRLAQLIVDRGRVGLDITPSPRG